MKTICKFRAKEMTQQFVDHVRNLIRRGLYRFVAVLSLFFLSITVVSAVDLESIDFSALPGKKTQLKLMFSEPIGTPKTFSTDEPARLVVDFEGVKNKLTTKTHPVNMGMTRSVSTIEAGGRTRMVVNLIKQVPYKIEQEGNVLLVTIDGGTVATTKRNTSGQAMYQVQDIDFRRGEQGEGRILISVDGDGVIVDMHQDLDTIIVDLMGVELPEVLQRRLDVLDFATPINMFDSIQRGGDTRLKITARGKYEPLIYQSENMIVIEVKPIAKEIQEAEAKKKFGYTGDKLSLNFQNIEVRAVLQVLADFTGLNLVTSDTVQGNVTLRLKNVPWDQALDIILKTKGLDKRIHGNVMLVAPAIEIAAQEKQELLAKQQIEELEPLISEVIEINFAKATELALIINGASLSGVERQGSSDRSTNRSASSISTEAGSFLTDRGSVNVDERTNSILLRDTKEQIAQIRQLIEQLDVPIRQVLIESRIVIATNDFSKELGVKWGYSAIGHHSNGLFNESATSGSLNGTTQLINGETLQQADRLNVSLPVLNPAGSIGLALAKLPFGGALELELSAMEAESKGEIISSPRVITSNQRTASIEQGTEIPYQTVGGGAAAPTVEFKEAVLRLEVTPQITPDDQIIMDLVVTKDQPTFDPRFPVPGIDTREIVTQVLVDNGETIVLGGVYEITQGQEVERVPWLGELPYIGLLFRTTKDVDEKTELLVFITPKIIKEELQF